MQTSQRLVPSSPQKTSLCSWLHSAFKHGLLRTISGSGTHESEMKTGEWKQALKCYEEYSDLVSEWHCPVSYASFPVYSLSGQCTLAISCSKSDPLWHNYGIFRGFPDGPDGEESACSVEDWGSIPGLERYPLEKEMATHSSILAWKISRMEEPGRLQSMGSQRVRQHWETTTFFFLWYL